MTDIVKQEMISCSRFLVKLIPNTQSFRSHRFYFHSFSCRQTNVVTCFGFHFLQNRIGVLLQVQINGIRGQNIEICFFEIPPVCIKIETKFLSQRIGLPLPYAVFVEMFFVFCPIRLPTEIVTNKYAVIRQKRPNAFRKLFQKHPLKFFRRLKLRTIRNVSYGVITVNLPYYRQNIGRNNCFIIHRSMKKIRLIHFKINSPCIGTQLFFHLRPKGGLLHYGSFK